MQMTFLYFGRKVNVFSHSLSEAIEIKGGAKDYSNKTIKKMVVAAKSHWDVVYENLKSLKSDEVIGEFYRLNGGGHAIQRVAARSATECPALKDDLFEYIASVAVMRELSKSLELLRQQRKLPSGKKEVFGFCKIFHVAANARARKAENVINYYIMGFNAKCGSGSEAWFDGKSNKLSSGDKIEMLSADRMIDGRARDFIDGLGVRGKGDSAVRDKISGFISKYYVAPRSYVSHYKTKGVHLPTFAMLDLLEKAVEDGNINEGEYLQLVNEVQKLHQRSTQQSNER